MAPKLLALPQELLEYIVLLLPNADISADSLIDMARQCRQRIVSGRTSNFQISTCRSTASHLPREQTRIRKICGLHRLPDYSFASWFASLDKDHDHTATSDSRLQRGPKCAERSTIFDECVASGPHREPRWRFARFGIVVLSKRVQSEIIIGSRSRQYISRIRTMGQASTAASWL
ncbi:hypothetical protein EK21DRAFT_90361 [Setomelanomma holmii]|uniref:Uncharacterized protein n=1 Tax=Setomelanomma holmii TaxID=210430 RepID=A0A9P4H907_9PLEO|nr:hypothetical protein EK21DRAFT_90361 [Setomelanomma holmii]